MRLNTHSQEIPKCLISIGAYSIIATILSTLKQAGIRDVTIVTGYKTEEIERHLGNGESVGLGIKYIFNDEWQKKNGVSVYSACHCFEPDEHFLLMMSDHIFTAAMLKRVMSFQIENGQIVLAVDKRIESIFDFDDATKVHFDGKHIRRTGKDLQNFNGIDCGLFKCTTGIFDALESSMVNGDCSLTDACKKLIQQKKMTGVDIEDAFWIDIDTPEALAYANQKLRGDV